MKSATTSAYLPSGRLPRRARVWPPRAPAPTLHRQRPRSRARFGRRTRDRRHARTRDGQPRIAGRSRRNAAHAAPFSDFSENSADRATRARDRCHDLRRTTPCSLPASKDSRSPPARTLRPRRAWPSPPGRTDRMPHPERAWPHSRPIGQHCGPRPLCVASAAIGSVIVSA